MTNSVRKLDDSNVPAVQSPQASGDTITGDILIPRLLLMQGISPLVAQRKAQIGELVRSTTLEKLGNPEQDVALVPIKMVNTWTNYEMVQGKPEYRGAEPRTAANAIQEWEYQKDGATWRRLKTITLYALLPGDVAAYEAELTRAAKAGEAPDLDRTVMPVVVTIQSTSFKHAGKKIASFFNTVRVNSVRVPTLTPYQYVLPLQAKSEAKGKNSWFVFDFGPAKPLKDKAVLDVAKTWSERLGTETLAVDDTADVAEADEPSDINAMDI